MKFHQVNPTLLDEGGRLRAMGASPRQERDARIIGGWIRNYLCQPHSMLGRSGPVCPFTTPAVRASRVWLGFAPETGGTDAEIAAAIAAGKERFLAIPDHAEEINFHKAVLVLFPQLNDAAGFAAIERVHAQLKPDFVRDGLMLGQFYRGCPNPGLSNPAFNPLFSPIPLFAIRDMIKSDIVFLDDVPLFRRLYYDRFPDGPAAN